MSRNPRLVTAFAVAAGSRFGLGVWLLYYLRLTDYRGVGLAEAIFIVTAFAAEIPTGVVADALGRRRTLMLHGGVTAAAYIALAAASSLAAICWAGALLALGRAFYSGTFEALVYETLQQEGRQSQYVATIGRLNAWRRGSLAVSSVVGGALYTMAPRLPYAAAAASFTLAALLAAGIQEPWRQPQAAPSARRLATQIRAGWRGLRPHLATGIVTFMLIAGALLVVTQEVLDDALAVQLGFSARQLGWLYALIYLTSAAASHRSTVLGRWLERRWLVLTLAMLAGVSLLLSPWTGMMFGGALVAFRYCLRAVWDNIRSDLLNQRFGSALRATALSTFAMLERVPYVLGAVAVGVAIERHGAAGVAVPLGVALLLICVIGIGLVRSRT